MPKLDLHDFTSMDVYTLLIGSPFRASQQNSYVGICSFESIFVCLVDVGQNQAAASKIQRQSKNICEIKQQFSGEFVLIPRHRVRLI